MIFLSAGLYYRTGRFPGLPSNGRDRQTLRRHGSILAGGLICPNLNPSSMAFSGLVYRKRGRDASPSFYVAPTGLDCSLLLLPRAMPWATIFRPFGAERNSLYSNSEIGLGS